MDCLSWMCAGFENFDAGFAQLFPVQRRTLCVNALNHQKNVQGCCKHMMPGGCGHVITGSNRTTMSFPSWTNSAIPTEAIGAMPLLEQQDDHVRS